MEITIQGLNMKVADKVEAHARRKLDKLDRYLPGITDVKLDLSSENARKGGSVQIAQLTVYHRRGAILRTEERVNDEFESAINQAVDKMYRQITRFKGKRVDRRRTGDRFEATAEELELAEAVPQEAAADGALAAVDAVPEVIDDAIMRRKVVSLTPMSEDDAIRQMELLAHDFFMFYNVDSDHINVLYKRDTGGYGVLVPLVS